MPAARARRIVLAAGDRHRLKRLERSQTAPWRQVLRARIVLLAARGVSNQGIACRVGVTADTARKGAAGSLPTGWRAWPIANGQGGHPLHGCAGRRGQGAGLPAAGRTGRAAVALELPGTGPGGRQPGDHRCGLGRHGRPVAAEDAIKPWQHRSWIFIRDPDFRAKAARILDLYAGIWDGVPLGVDEYVLCADEKTSIQARCRCHPTLPPGRARMLRVNHDYDRGGALAYLAADDVARARVFGRCAPWTGIKPFMALVTQVMTQQPYASAKRVFWIVDNGSSHRGQAAIDRLAKRFPNAVMIHTPTHASWVNQVEIYFSVVQRKVVSPNDFTHLDQVRQRLADFQQRYNATARPFQWKFTPTDLDDLLARIDQHQQTTAPTIPQAA